MSDSIVDNVADFQQDGKHSMPNNIEAEQAIIGAFLHNNENVNQVSDLLLPEHFFLPIHQKIYSIIIRFIDRSLTATPLTLKTFFANDESFKNSSTNAFDYMMQLVSNADLVVNVKALSSVLYDLYLRRCLIEIGSDMTADRNNDDDTELSAIQKLETVEQKLFNLAQYNNYGNFTTISTAFDDTLEHVDQIMRGVKKTNGLSTGFEEMDDKTGGLQDSDLIIIAARPSMGKTAFAVNIAVNIAKQFDKESEKNPEHKTESVAIFSLEMSSSQIANRILSMQTGIDSSRIRSGHMSKDEFTILSKESANISNIPLFIDDTAALTISSIRTRARRMKRKHNISIIIIDYLQLILPSHKSNNTNRVQEIAEVSQGLKALAKELNIPIIALSQLSRAVENREDKRPQLSDLRESGNIEQDADLVAFLYREEYYLKRKNMEMSDDMEWQKQVNKVRNISEIIISKHRNGPVGQFYLYFNSNTTKFKNLHRDNAQLNT